MSRSSKWETIYINNPPAPFGEHTTAIKLNGWQVVNAPRPIPGEVEWVGEFRHGIFYAAGKIEDYGKAWDDLDAWPVEEITNLQIVERLKQKAAEIVPDETFAEVVQKYFHGDMSRFAFDYNFPGKISCFRPPTTTSKVVWR